MIYFGPKDCDIFFATIKVWASQGAQIVLYLC